MPRLTIVVVTLPQIITKKLTLLYLKLVHALKGRK